MRTRGRPKGPWEPQPKATLALIKERHHTVARMFAVGQTRNVIAALTGYTPERIGQLYHDPAMQELIAQYRNSPEIQDHNGISVTDLTKRIMERNMLRAAMQHSDTLTYYEEADERMPVRDSTRILEASADRVGLGKHATQTVVHDFATQLDLAIERSRSARVVGNSPRPLVLVEGTSGPSTPLGRGERGKDLVHVPSPSLDRRF